MKPTRSDHLSDAELALRGMSRETEIVLTADGRFLVSGREVDHPGTAAAFARWVERLDQGPQAGRYVLRNDLHYVYLSVEGAPLFARSVAFEGEHATLELLGGERDPLRPQTLREGPDGTLYADGRDGTWPVRFQPRALLELEPYLAAEGEATVLRLGGDTFPIPRVEDPLTPRSASAR